MLALCMKTITLTDEAYERLQAWKQGDGDSFSKVVLRVVAKRGTLRDLAEQIDRLPPLTPDQAATIEAAVAWSNDPRNHPDPWEKSPASALDPRQP